MARSNFVVAIAIATMLLGCVTRTQQLLRPDLNRSDQTFFNKFAQGNAAESESIFAANGGQSFNVIGNAAVISSVTHPVKAKSETFIVNVESTSDGACMKPPVG